MPERERCKGIAVQETESSKYYNSHFLHLSNYAVEAAWSLITCAEQTYKPPGQLICS